MISTNSFQIEETRRDYQLVGGRSIDSDILAKATLKILSDTRVGLGDGNPARQEVMAWPF